MTVTDPTRVTEALKGTVPPTVEPEAGEVTWTIRPLCPPRGAPQLRMHKVATEARHTARVRLLVLIADCLPVRRPAWPPFRSRSIGLKVDLEKNCRCCQRSEGVWPPARGDRRSVTGRDHIECIDDDIEIARQRAPGAGRLDGQRVGAKLEAGHGVENRRNPFLRCIGVDCRRLDAIDVDVRDPRLRAAEANPAHAT